MNKDPHHGPFPHESAEGHVTGEAVYVDDIPASEQLLIGRVMYSPHARAGIRSFDLTEARKVPGVHAVLSFRDIPGHNQMGPVVKDEPCLAEEEVTFCGQALFLIAAETEEECLMAEVRIKVEWELRDAILDIETAIRQNNLLGSPRRIECGNVETALAAAECTFEGELRTGAQEHWYLETHVALCVPGEGNEMTVYSSTQHPSETQVLVAGVLGAGSNDVVVEVRRIGGGFGGKETQANHAACWAALLSRATRRPVKIRLFRDDDMIMTGKRHRFLTRYCAGFTKEGMLTAVKLELNSDGGAATDLSFAILERAMLHVDNSYYIPNLSVTGFVWRTNLPSNTAMRGFGGPQGMAAIETIIDRIARFLKCDAAEIRKRNFYGIGRRGVTHYGQTVNHNKLHGMYEQLFASSDYYGRRRDVNTFNASHEFAKKGLALTPVKFGISFTTTFLNQAGALVNIYTDGTILVNHGGTEMGQGLYTKIRGIAAREFGVSIDRVKVNATNTSKVPNTSATAASSGSDMNGMAVKNAADTLKTRIAASVAALFSELAAGTPTEPADISFQENCILDCKHPDRRIEFAEAMRQMQLRRVSLSATGYYSTPDIGWDREKGRGNPFYYYVFGMAVSEVLVDLLTGDHTILRTDILHDPGTSLNPAIDLGQVEGGFVQGVGWCTTEEIKWDQQGHLMTHSPDTYKIPSVCSIPIDFRAALFESEPNPGTIRGSKAVGEPPFMLAFSVWLAIKDAISAVADHEIEFDFPIPATNEVILLAADALKTRSHVKDTAP